MFECEYDKYYELFFGYQKDNDFFIQYINNQDIDLSYNYNQYLKKFCGWLNHHLKGKDKPSSYFEKDYLVYIHQIKLLLLDDRVIKNAHSTIADLNMDIIQDILDYLKEHNREHLLDLNDYFGFDLKLTKKFISACKSGNYKLYKELVDNPLVKIDYQDNEAFCEACSNGRLKIAKDLITRKEVNPCSQDQRPLLAASFSNKSQLLKLLLEDGRVDISFRNNLAPAAAFSANCKAAMNVYLKQPNFDISFGNNFILYHVCKRLSQPLYLLCGYKTCISYLLTFKKVTNNITPQFVKILLEECSYIRDSWLVKELHYVAFKNKVLDF